MQDRTPSNRDASPSSVEITLNAPDLVRSFYVERAARRLWVYEGRIQGRALELLEILEKADSEGLGDEDYHLPTLNELLYRTPISSADLRAFEMLATDAMLSYAEHLAGRRVDPDSVYLVYQAPRKALDPLACLTDAFAHGQSVEAALDCLRPDHEAYQGLRGALVRMRRIAEAGGWSTLPETLVLRPGDMHPSVPLLRARMLRGGDLDTFVISNRYDERLTIAVNTFQTRHGLPDDGVVGPETVAALNVTADARVEQIMMNLERLRWLPRGVSSRRIQVNIPDYRLEVFEEDESVLSLRAIVGRLDRPTPVLNGRITSMVLNPYWNVPPNLARLDMLPHIKRDSTYLSRRKIRVYDSWKRDAEELDPSSIDWKGMVSEKLPYVLRQDPGPLNPLGRVKFMFWNDYSVFIHDTSSRGKFNAQRRAYSSGCIRVEDPMALASFVMGLDREEKSESESLDLQAVLETKEQQVLAVPKPLPVVLMYLTAWQDGDVLHFRDDVYGYDRSLEMALARRQDLPIADGSGVHMDEARAGVPTHASASQGASGPTEVSQLDVAHP